MNDAGEQPDEVTHRVRSGRVPVELGRITLLVRGCADQPEAPYPVVLGFYGGFLT